VNLLEPVVPPVQQGSQMVEMAVISFHQDFRLFSPLATVYSRYQAQDMGLRVQYRAMHGCSVDRNVTARPCVDSRVPQTQ